MRCDYVDQRILITLQALADDESLIVVDHPRHPVDQPVDTELTQQAIALVHPCIGIIIAIVIAIVIIIHHHHHDQHHKNMSTSTYK